MIGPAVTETAKMVSGILVSSGVSTMVGYAAKSSVPKVIPIAIRRSPVLIKSWKVFQKFAIPAGAAALAGMASEQAVKYSDKKIDENVAMANQLEVNMREYLANLRKDAKDAKDSKTESEDTK